MKVGELYPKTGEFFRVCKKSIGFLIYLGFLGPLVFSQGLVEQERYVIQANSGGVALGSNQAGYLYGSELWFQKNHRKKSVVTGASAGGINALLNAYYNFFDVKGPSLYYKWIDIGLDELLDTTGNKRYFFTQKHFKKIAEEVLDLWIDNPPTRNQNDSIILGFALTRFHPRTEKLAQIKIGKQDEKFQLQIKYDHEKARWEVENKYDTTTRNTFPYLDFGPEGADKARIKQVLKDLILATSAFPGAFFPYKFSYYVIDKDVLKKYSKSSQLSNEKGKILHRDVKFSDGGLFENEPIRLAYHMHRKFFPAQKDSGALANAKIYFVSPTEYNFVSKKPYVKKRESDKMILFWFPLLSNYIASAFSKELSTLASETREINRYTFRTSKTSFPLYGELYGHFGAFFEEDFRKFDYIVGLNDAINDFGDQSIIDLVDTSYLKPLICMKEVLNDAHWKEENIENVKQLPSCKDINQNEFIPLLQASLHTKIKALIGPGYSYKPNKTAFKYLQKYGFHYKDLSKKGKALSEGKAKRELATKIYKEYKDKKLIGFPLERFLDIGGFWAIKKAIATPKFNRNYYGIFAGGNGVHIVDDKNFEVKCFGGDVLECATSPGLYLEVGRLFAGWWTVNAQFGYGTTLIKQKSFFSGATAGLTFFDSYFSYKIGGGMQYAWPFNHRDRSPFKKSAELRESLFMRFGIFDVFIFSFAPTIKHNLENNLNTFGVDFHLGIQI